MNYTDQQRNCDKGLKCTINHFVQLEMITFQYSEFHFLLMTTMKVMVAMMMTLVTDRQSHPEAHGLATPQSQVVSCFQMDKHKNLLKKSWEFM